MVSLKLAEYEPVNDIYLLRTDTKKQGDEPFEKTKTGIIIQQKSIVESRSVLGTIVKKGPKCDDTYEIGDIINYYPEAGIDIVFDDNEYKFVLIGDEKFLGRIKKQEVNENG